MTRIRIPSWPSAATISTARAASITCSIRRPSPSCSTRCGRRAPQTFQEYTDLIDKQNRQLCTLRGLLRDQELGRADAARGSGAGQGDREALRHRRHVVRLHPQGSARDAGDRHEPHRRQVQHRRGRRRRGALRRPSGAAPSSRWLGALRRDHQLPGERRRAADQDGAGRQARRGRPAARPQGGRGDRARAPLDSRGGPDFAAAAPRHLLHRRPGAADLRSEERQPAGAHFGEAGGRSGRGHGGRGRGQGARRRGADLAATAAAPALRRSAPSSTPAFPGSWAWPKRSRCW